MWLSIVLIRQNETVFRFWFVKFLNNINWNSKFYLQTQNSFKKPNPNEVWVLSSSLCFYVATYKIKVPRKIRVYSCLKISIRHVYINRENKGIRETLLNLKYLIAILVSTEKVLDFFMRGFRTHTKLLICVAYSYLVSSLYKIIHFFWESYSLFKLINLINSKNIAVGPMPGISLVVHSSLLCLQLYT